MRKVEQSEVAMEGSYGKKKEKRDFKISCAATFNQKQESRIRDRASKEIERAPPRSFAVLPLLGHMETYLNTQ